MPAGIGNGAAGGAAPAVGPLPQHPSGDWLSWIPRMVVLWAAKVESMLDLS